MGPGVGPRLESDDQRWVALSDPCEGLKPWPGVLSLGAEDKSLSISAYSSVCDWLGLGWSRVNLRSLLVVFCRQGSGGSAVHCRLGLCLSTRSS